MPENLDFKPEPSPHNWQGSISSTNQLTAQLGSRLPARGIHAQLPGFTAAKALDRCRCRFLSTDVDEQFACSHFLFLVETLTI